MIRELDELQPNTQDIVINDTLVRVELSHGRIRPRVCFLGPRGTYTEEAKEALFGDQVIDEEPVRVRNEQIVGLIDSCEYDLAVIAAENSTEGDVTETQRALIAAHDTLILGETVRKIDHMLIGRTDEEITQILSHPQALGQCRKYLSELYPLAQLVETSSTSDAVDKIKTLQNAGAIASRSAAHGCGLAILGENIGDNKRNATRFYLIGRGETYPTGKDVTSLIFVPEVDRTGVLRDILTIFADRKINLNHISSHPTGELDAYMFRMSFRGHKKEPQVQDALQELNAYCSKVRILGSYKEAPIPEGVRRPGAINGNGHL